MKTSHIAAALLLQLGLVARLGAADNADWQFSLNGSYEYGAVDGYIQTPAGGETNTTSDKRPKLDEVGINNTSLYTAELSASRNDDGFYLGGEWINMSGSDRLGSDLISNGKSFAAGTQVDAKVDLDWYRFGYRRRFAIGQSGEWTLSPSVGAAVLDFRYHLSDAGTTADRNYIKANVQFGLEGEWRPRGGPFSINLLLLGCLPASALPQMDVERLVAKYRLVDNARCEFDLFGGVGFEQINYEDNQTVSNRIDVNLGPMFVFGLNVQF